MTTAKTLARYGAIGGALPERLLLQLHHHLGHDPSGS